MEYESVIIGADDLRDKINEKIEGFKIEIGRILDDAETYMRVAHVPEEEDTPKFKVGDVITGKEGNGYVYTTNESVLLVTDIIDSERVEVKLLDHKVLPDKIGEEFEVESKYFKLITDIL